LGTKELGRKYGILFTVFIFSLILLLIYNLFSLNRDRLDRHEPTKVYFADNMSAAHITLIDQFNRLHQNEIEIIPIDLPFSKFTTNERKELIARSLRDKDSRIDIFAVDQIWVPRFAKWAEPLAKYFTQKELATLVPQALTTCYYDQVLVGIPLYIDEGVLYYRSDLLKRVSSDPGFEKRLRNSIGWDELIRLGKQYSNDQMFYLFQGDNYEGLICNYFEILLSMGGEVFQDGKIKFNTPVGRQSIQFMADLIYKYQISPKEVYGYNEQESYVCALRNNAPFFRGWSSFLKDVTLTPADSAKRNLLRMASLPHFEGRPEKSVFGGWDLMISKNSSNKMEAVKFLEFIISVESQKTLFSISGYPPIRREVYTDPEILAQYPYLRDIEKRIQTGAHRPMLTDYTKISDILSLHLNNVLKRETTPRQALQEVDAAISTNQYFVK